MIKNQLYYKLQLIFLSLSLVYTNSVNAACNDECIPYEQRINYLKEGFNSVEGDLIFKMHVLFSKLNDKIKKMPSPTVLNPSPMSTSEILKSAYGVDSSISYFIVDKIALELAVGLMHFRTHHKVLNSIFSNYNGKRFHRGAMYFIPFTGTAQYHIAPYGGIQPYVGAGYHATYIKSKIRGIDINNHHGPVLQAGINLVFSDLTLINFDIKQYFANANIKFSKPFVDNNFSRKLKTNPLVFSIGFGFGF